MEVATVAVEKEAEVTAVGVTGPLGLNAPARQGELAAVVERRERVELLERAVERLGGRWVHMKSKWMRSSMPSDLSMRTTLSRGWCYRPAR